MYQRLHAIVLFASKYPRGYVVNCYTRERGRMAVVVNNGKGQSLLKRLIVQPLSQVEIEVREGTKEMMPHVVEGRCAYIYNELPYDFTKNTIGLFLADVLSAVLKDEQGDEGVYDFVVSSFQLLDRECEGVANFHLAFLSQLLTLLGIAPNMNKGNLPYFDVAEGEYTLNEGGIGIISGAALQRFETLMGMTYENMSEVALQRVDRAEMLNCLIEYYEMHLQLHLHIRSLEVLHSLYS